MYSRPEKGRAGTRMLDVSSRIGTAVGTMGSESQNSVYKERNINMTECIKCYGYRPKNIKDSAWKIHTRDQARHEKGWNSSIRKVFDLHSLFHALYYGTRAAITKYHKLDG